MVTWLTQSRFRCCQGACRVEQQLASSALLGCLVPSQILYPYHPFLFWLLLLRCGSNGVELMGSQMLTHTQCWFGASARFALSLSSFFFSFWDIVLKCSGRPWTCDPPASNSQITRFIGMVYFSFCCFLPTPPLRVSLLSALGLLTLVFTLPFGPCVQLLQR